ncbi:MAG: hypothetical protein JOZ42_01295 [Acetobacteraceae bacterium]|nr:hypothetical protein [Acetobacteraceae bacterium]
MIESRLAATLLLVATAAIAEGCAPKAPARQASRQYFVDQGGVAPTCTTSQPELKDGQVTAAEMTVGGGPGHCSFSVSRDGAAYAAGLLTAKPEHGEVYIHTVGDATRIDYTPQPSYGGPDGFTVELLPGSPSLRVAVTAIRSTAAAPEPPPAAASEPPAKRPPARRPPPKKPAS